MWLGRSLALEIVQAQPIWTTRTQLAKATKVGTKARRQIFTRGTLANAATRVLPDIQSSLEV